MTDSRYRSLEPHEVLTTGDRYLFHGAWVYVGPENGVYNRTVEYSAHNWTACSDWQRPASIIQSDGKTYRQLDSTETIKSKDEYHFQSSHSSWMTCLDSVGMDVANAQSRYHSFFGKVRRLLKPEPQVNFVTKALTNEEIQAEYDRTLGSRVITDGEIQAGRDLVGHLIALDLDPVYRLSCIMVPDL